MKISNSDRKRFSKLVSTIVEDADDDVTLNRALNKLALDDLERLKTYLSGSMSINPFYLLRFIVIYSFLGGLIIYFVYIYQTNAMVLSFAIGLSIGVLIEGILTIVKVPLLTHSIVTYRRRKYDRIVQVIEMILKKRYLKELKNAVIGF
ncbi:hypothetical protein HB943_14460 [Listeria weihenstephanensis]|uniref:Uncharacterized protein n=1 Tax=Listeria weihenstephanensis TaxID=1006155 RepID=A0A841Z6Z8_9LIST|nr:hypothetical protein [Listeria weihenstephanensis]MBC1501801.1 hypothetical protein [Listeria weihenstephanensis]